MFFPYRPGRSLANTWPGRMPLPTSCSHRRFAHCGSAVRAPHQIDGPLPRVLWFFDLTVPLSQCYYAGTALGSGVQCVSVLMVCSWSMDLIDPSKFIPGIIGAIQPQSWFYSSSFCDSL
jgi:hypothetical protein